MKGLLPLAAMAVTLLVPAVPADHIDDGTYRCDGGWCADGKKYVLWCSPHGCSGQTDGFTTIRNPQFGAGDWLDGDDAVIGIAAQGEAKAYPLRIISGQQGWELVEDDVGGLPVVVTYCPLCGSPIAFSRLVDGRVFHFLNTGAIWRFDLVMFDEQTGSQWSQVAGEAIDGPMHGRTLDLLDHLFTTWGEWLDRHPDSTAMERPHGTDGRPLCSCDTFHLGASSLVTGGEVDGQVVAFRHAHLGQRVGVIPTAGGGVVGAAAGDTIHVYLAAGQDFTEAGPDAMQASDGRVFDRATGRADDGTQLERLATRTTFATRWDAFFPETLYYDPPAPSDGNSEGAYRGTPAAGLVAVAGALVLGGLLRRSRRS